MRCEAVSKNRPADLVNIALEKVVEAGLELQAEHLGWVDELGEAGV